METWRKPFKLWESKFQKNEYSIICRELADLDLAAKDKALLAHRCLMSLNVTSKKNLISNVPTTSKYLEDLHQLATLCCRLISVAWKSMECDLVTNVFYICKILLHRKRFVEASGICHFILEYFEECSDAKLSFKSDEINVPSRYILMFLHSTVTSSLNLDEESEVFCLWNSILSSCEKRIIRANFSSVVDYFAVFLPKITKEDFIRHEKDLMSLIKKFYAAIILHEPKAEEIFFKCFLNCVSTFCEFSTKNNLNFFIDCFDLPKTMKGVEFCENIYRICSGVLANDDITHLITASKEQLQTLIRAGVPVHNAVVYCAAIIIVKMSLEKLGEYALDESSIGNLFSIILSLAHRLMDIDINELFAGKKEGSRKIDLGTVAVLSIDLIACCNSMKNIDLGNEVINESVLDAEELAITCMKSLDEKRREQLKQFFGASCINLCKMYMAADSPTQNTQCKNLCCNLLQYYSTLPANELQSPIFRMFTNKLVLCLCRNYRSLEMYEEWIKTALAWSLITPANSEAFMEQFCTAKYKLSSTNSKSLYIDYTCLDILKRMRDLWKHKNLETVSAVYVCALELKAYLKNNLLLPKPITALLKRLKYEDSANHVLLGNVYYSKFRLKLLSFREENEAEVKSLAPQKADPSNQEDAYVLGSYNFNNQKDVLKLLNTAVDNWTAAIEPCRYSNKPKEGLNELEVSYLKEAALIYRLYCDSTKEIDVWKLLYVASKYREDFEVAVYAVSNLLCTSWKINHKWLKEIEEVMLDKVGEAVKLRYRLDSYNIGFTEGFTPELMKSLQEITRQEVKEHNLLAKYCYLMARIYFHRILEYKADPFEISYTAVSNLMEALERAKWNHSFAETCESESLLLDIFVFLVARCVEKFELANAESFVRESLKMVQSMGLPLRTCQLLNLSAFLDTLVGRLEECFVKLQYASSILNHNVKPIARMRNELPTPVLASDLRFVKSDYDTDFEDNPALNSELQFEMPAFASHLKKCECDICANGEYLRLYCELMSVYGIYFRSLNKWLLADDFFQGVFKLLKYARKRIDIVALKASTLIQCGNYWAAQSRLKEAGLCNSKVMKMFGTDLDGNHAQKVVCLDQQWQLFAVKFFALIEQSRTVHDQKRIPKVNPSQPMEPPSTVKKLQRTVQSAAITPCPRKSRKVLLFDDFSTPPSSSQDRTEKNQLFTTPPASVMDLPPSTVQKRRTRRHPN